MARKTMREVYFYLALLNDKLESMGKDIEYHVTERYGYKVLQLMGPNGCVKWDRPGYTTGQIYEVLYNMYEMLCRF